MGAILADYSSISKVLEIGIGTNNVDLISNMGADGVPGASLRAFRDFLPNAQIFGADIDESLLFTEDRIRTFAVDQTDPASIQKLAHGIGEHFDLIIDDGLHAPHANIATLTFAMGKLKVGGWCVIEDVPPVTLPLWHVVSALLPPEFAPSVIEAKGALVVAVQRVG